MSAGDELRFDGRVAIVTGAGRGIGRAHALLLAARGAALVVNDYGKSSSEGAGETSSPADDVVREIVSAGGKAIADYSDVSDFDAARALVDKAVSTFGRVDILVNNAGIYQAKPFEAVTREQFERTLMVHVGGHYGLSQAVWPVMTRQGGGRIVMTASATALFGFPDSTDYGAAKGAIVGLTRTLSFDGASRGIVVNAVVPVAYTRMSAPYVPNEEERRAFEAGMRADQISPLVAWLAHDSCPARGEIFGAAGGRIVRVFIAETRGVVDPDLSVESIARNVEVIGDEVGYRIPEDGLSFMGATGVEIGDGK